MVAQRRATDGIKRRRMFKNPTAGDQEACEGASARRNKNKMSKHTLLIPRGVPLPTSLRMSRPRLNPHT